MAIPNDVRRLHGFYVVTRADGKSVHVPMGVGPDRINEEQARIKGEKILALRWDRS